MILHIVEVNDKFILFGFDIKQNKKLGRTGPKSLVASINGYVPATKKLKPTEYVIPEHYFYGWCENTPKSISEMLKKKEITKLLIDKGARKLLRYMLSGSVFNGYQDSDFSFNIRDLKSSSFTVNHSDFEVLKGYAEELSLLSETLEKEKLYNKKGDSYWEPKVPSPFWLIGNTLIYLKSDKRKAYVSVSTSLAVKKEDVAVKNNNIHKVLSDTNYTISLTSDSEIIDWVTEHQENDLAIPLLIKPKNLFSKDTLRSIATAERLKSDTYYNCVENLALNGSSVSVLFSPPGLLFKMQTEVFRVIDTVWANDGLIRIDITDAIIDKSTGKVFKSFNNTELVKIPYKKIKIVVRLGVDTLTKPAFNKMKKPKIHLCIYDNEEAFKYVTEIHDEETGKKLISYAPFNNKGLL